VSDPTLKLTYDDLRIRVAEFLGVAYYGAAGNEAAQVPTDAHDLDKVSRLVNNGYRRFLRDNKRGWNFMTVPLSITFGTGTVGGDNARYYLPDDFYGLLVTPFTFDSSGPRIAIDPVSEQELRELQAANDSSGDPVVVAFRAINTTETATGQRWEAIFYPEPSGTQTVTATYKRFPAALSSGTHRPVSGFQHDPAILEACLAAAELEVGDSAGPHEAAYQRELKVSLELDARASHHRSKDYGDKSEDRLGRRRPFSYYGVDTYNGNSID